MKMMFCSLAFVFVGFSSFAQTTPSDPEAKQILDKATAKIKSYKAVEVHFTLQVLDGKGISQGTKTGTVLMKANKYKVLITGQEIFCDGKSIWTYDKSSNEVTITKYDPNSNTISPQKLFANFYDKDFLYKVNGEQKTGTKTVQEIEMTPIDKTKNFYKIYLYIDKHTHLLTSGKVLDKSGNRYIYTVNSLVGKTDLPESNFIFDKTKYPGVEEVNLQ
jgi:outer membrane lipoprotein carrier protein